MINKNYYKNSKSNKNKNKNNISPILTSIDN